MGRKGALKGNIFLDRHKIILLSGLAEFNLHLMNYAIAHYNPTTQDMLMSSQQLIANQSAKRKKRCILLEVLLKFRAGW